MSRYLRTAPEYRELGSFGDTPAKTNLTPDEKKALALAMGVGTVIGVVKWSVIGFIGYKIIKAVAK
jgi:hypothetical protein